MVNPVLLSVLLSFAVSQLIKFIILYSKKEKHAFEALYREYEGMPSTHSAVVAALVFSVYFFEGFSNLFFVSLAFAVIIVVDVIDSKWFYSKRDKILNELIEKHNCSNKEKVDAISGEFGHTVLEVIAGIAIAFVISLAVNLI